MQLIPQENARADIARALVLTEVFCTPYSETPLYALERALAGGSSEFRIAEEKRDDELVALALYGDVAGTVGTARLYLIAPCTGRLRESARQALESAADGLRREGARLLIAEVADDDCTAPMRELLLESGFQEESRVENLFREGVALLFYRRELRY